MPQGWTLVNDGEIELRAFLGPADIVLTSSLGSDSITLQLQLNASPTLELASSDPETVTTTAGLTILTASQPGDIAYVLGSLSNVPTSLPGLASVDLGNGGLALLILDVRVINGTNGYEETTVPLAGVPLPPGTKLFVQAAVIDGTTLALPAVSTNLQVGTIAP